MERSGFFNAELVGEEYDRIYKAEFFAEYFASFIGNGVFPNPSTGLQVTSNNNMTVTVKAGRAWINGYYYCNDSDLILSVDVADGVLSRIDRIVLRYDTIDRTISVKVKKGAFASTPVAQGLQRDADAYELGIADIAVNKGAVSISQANIIDLRLNSSLCGIVHGTVDQVDTTTLWNQYKSKFEETSEQFEADFQSWFTGIQGALSGDVAGNLLNQINDLAGSGRTTETVKGNADAITALDKKVTSHQADSLILIAGGTANAITLPITLKDKNKYSFKAVANSTGAVTINSIALKKLDGTAVSNIKANKVYDFFYDEAQNSVFILAKAEGDVTAGDVLAGKIYSSNEEIGGVGTMVDRGAVVITPSIVNQTIQGGKHNGNGYVKGDSSLIPENILSGKSIFGVAGIAIPFNPFVAGDSLICSAPTQRQTAMTTPYKLKEIRMKIGGVIRVKFDLSCSYGGRDVFARIYVNNNPKGILRSTSLENPTTYSEDISINNGDLIQLYGYISMSSVYCYVTNFKVCAINNDNVVAFVNLD